MSTSVRGLFACVLHSHIPYVMAHGRTPHGMDWLSESAVETYLPLLDTCDRLIADGISPRFTIGITPVLAEQMAHPEFNAEFDLWIDFRLAAAAESISRWREANDTRMAALAQFWLERYQEAHRLFHEVYDGNMLRAFRRLQDAGHIEIITSAATHGYLPLLGDDRNVRAQIRTGVETYRKHFGKPPHGFWLPECAYRPAGRWRRPTEEAAAEVHRLGVDELLSEAGIRYFFADSGLIEGGRTLGVYADRFKPLAEMWRHAIREVPQGSPTSPNDVYLVDTSDGRQAPVAVFFRDPDTGRQVWSAAEGYPGDHAYLEFHKKYELGGLRFWKITQAGISLGLKQVYDPTAAYFRVRQHADHFVSIAAQVAQWRYTETGRKAVITAMYDTELYGHWWFEGPEWLYHTRRSLEEHPDLQAVTCSECLDIINPSDMINLPEGSWGEGGFHYVWLNHRTEQFWHTVYACEDRVAYLTDRLADAEPDERIRPLHQQICRELVLLESSDWPFLITNESAADYAQQRIEWHAGQVHRLCDLAEAILDGHTPTPEEWGRLADAETRDVLFPHIDPTWWATAP